MNKKFLVLILLIIGGMFFLLPQSRAYSRHPLMKQKFRNIVLQDQQSQTVALKDVLEHKKSIVVFWTTWCPHCRSTIQDLVKKEKEFQDNGIQVVLVNISENKNKVLNFLQNLGIGDSCAILFDLTQEAALAYRVQGIPVIFFITEEGTIVHIDGRVPTQYQEVFSKKH